MENKLEDLKDGLDKDMYMAKMISDNANKKHIRDAITIWLLIICLVASNAYWVYYNAQWEYTTVTETIQVDSEDNGIAAYNSGEGDVSIGENNSKQDD